MGTLKTDYLVLWQLNTVQLYRTVYVGEKRCGKNYLKYLKWFLLAIDPKGA